MIRSVAFLLHILSLVAPNFPERDAAARLLVELGRKGNFDPVTLAAIVKGESDWDPSAVSKDGRDFGLAQVRATNFPECGSAFDAERCDWRKQSLLHWRMNLTIAARYIVANRERCERLVGSGLAVWWLQGFQGISKRGVVCGHRKERGRFVAVAVPAVTRKVLARRREMGRHTWRAR